MQALWRDHVSFKEAVGFQNAFQTCQFDIHKKIILFVKEKEKFYPFLYINFKLYLKNNCKFYSKMQKLRKLFFLKYVGWLKGWISSSVEPLSHIKETTAKMQRLTKWQLVAKRSQSTVFQLCEECRKVLGFKIWLKMKKVV